MSRELHPIAGRWYRDLDRDELFKVVSVDEDDDLIEIQHDDGELEDLESAEWFELDLERASQPEDWEHEDDNDDEDEDEGDDEDSEEDDWDDEDDDDSDDSRDEY